MSLLTPVSIAIITFAYTIALYTNIIGGEHFIFYKNFLAIFFSFTVVVIGYFSLREKKHTLYHKPLSLILIGVFLWFLGEFIWFVWLENIYIFSETLRLIGYIPMAFGFFYILRSSNHEFWKQRKFIIMIILSFLIFSLVYMTLVPLFFGQVTLLDSITVNGYIIADFILVLGIILLIYVSYKYKGTFLSLVWIIFALSFISAFIFDIYFAFIWQQYEYNYKLEILIHLNYILLSLGFYLYSKYEI